MESDLSINHSVKVLGDMFRRSQSTLNSSSSVKRQTSGSPQSLPHQKTHPAADHALTSRDASGLVLGERYRLEERIGYGGMGTVYRAHHLLLKSTHAVKIISPELLDNDPSLTTRFQQEAIAAAAIRHQNVVAVTDFGVTGGGLPFLVMDYVRGKTLDSYLEAEGKISLESALEMMAAICAGVGAAHRLGIVHRDLKPLNIMLQDDLPFREGVKVFDFGLAKIKSRELLGSFVEAQTAGLLGSPYYMAPEQWSDEEPDRRADIYSLGIILYQMLAGDVPFRGPALPAMMKKHLTALPPPIGTLGGLVPWEVEAVVRHALEKDPAKRPTSVEAFLDELREAINVTKALLPVFQKAPLISEQQCRASGVFTPHSLPLTAPLDRAENGLPLIAPTAEGLTNNESVKESYPAEHLDQITGREAEPPGNLAGIVEGPVPGTELKNILHSRRSHSRAPHTAAGESSVIRRRTLLVCGTVAAIILLLLCGAYLIRPKENLDDQPKVKDESRAEQVSQQTAPTPVSTPRPQRDMIVIPGGSFQMGRDPAAPDEGAFSNEWPAHRVSVDPLYMDRTEVTNAEYAEFVRATDREPLAGWKGNRAPAGKERWPVTNVSFDDARKFAEWRSQRDGINYRLPTEEEWEYVARAGDSSFFYPWGAEWITGCANIGTDSPTAVGSYSRGVLLWEVEDLIGNVWEWTSSQASFYAGNSRSFPAKEREWVVVRGGSYRSIAEGEGAVTATSRGWVAPTTRDSTLGFRLVRPLP